MDASQIETGKTHRVRQSGHERIVTVVRKSGAKSPLWRCRTDNGHGLVAALADFVAPVDGVRPSESQVPVVRNSLYRVRHGAEEIVVEILYASREVTGGWIVRRFIDGDSFTIHGADVLEAVQTA